MTTSSKLAVGTGDGSLDLRIRDLINRGLELYGGGDLEGAMNAWRHALALDGENQLAADYVAYVKRHFAMHDEQASEPAFSASDAELEIPFGLVTMEPIDEAGIDIYESFEVGGVFSSPDVGENNDFSEEVPTNVRPASLDLDVDEGWSLELDEETSGGHANPLIEVRTDRGSGPEARLGADLDLEGALEAVHEGLGQLDEPESSGSLEVELEITDPNTVQIDAPPDLASALELDPDIDLGKGGGGVGIIGGKETGPPPIAGAELDLGESGAAARPRQEIKQTMLGIPRGREPSDIHLRGTAEIEPSALGAALDALANVGIGAEPLDDGSLDTGEPDGSAVDLALGTAPDYPEITVQPPMLTTPRTASNHGDAPISFREPGDPPGMATAAAALESLEGLEDRDGLETSKLGPTGIEDQLAELEHEMKTGSREVEWTAHDGSSAGLDHNPVLPDRPGSPGAPPIGGVDALASQILADVEHAVDASADEEERTRNRIILLIDYAQRETEKDEHSVAAVAADLALAESPNSAAAQKLIHEKSDLLVAVFRRHLGNLEGIPAVALPLHELSLHELDHRTAFLLSRVDGSLSLEDILDVSGMPRLEAFRYLTRLVLRGILEIR